MPHSVSDSRSAVSTHPELAEVELNPCALASGFSFAPRIVTNKQTPWPLVRERTIPTDRPPLVDEI
jgi:hypothetical protein